MSGAAAQRLSVVTPNALICPLRTYGNAAARQRSFSARELNSTNGENT
jgi:hypothetical protein